MKNIKILAVILCLVLVFGLTFIVAKGGDTNSSNKVKIRGFGNHLNNSNSSLQKTRIMNYGLCVSSSTKTKNSCFRDQKKTFNTCEKQIRQKFKQEMANNSTGTINRTQILTQIRDENKACRDAYKTELDQCKTAFNTTREGCEVWRCQSNQTFGNGTCIHT